MVTERIRWVTLGGTPAVAELPSLLMVFTTSCLRSPARTASRWRERLTAAPSHDEPLAPPVLAEPVLAMATDPRGTAGWRSSAARR